MKSDIISDGELIDALQINVSMLQKERDVWKRRFHEKRQENERLERERDELLAFPLEARARHLIDAIERAEAAEAENARLRSALGPFATALSEMEKLHGDHLRDDTRVRPGIYMGDLRTARSAIGDQNNG